MFSPQRKSRFVDEAHRLVGCQGKVKYGDQATADAKLKGMRGRFKKLDRSLASYRCQFCKCWHLGRGKRGSSSTE